MASRFVALLTGVTLALVPLAGTASAAPAAPAAPRTVLPDDAAAGWLARQLVDGDHLETSFGGVGYPDQGLTIDAVFAFAAAKVADDSAARATAWLARPENLTTYIGDGGDEAYSGATAKLLLAAQVRRVDATSFGGVDLPARLRSLLAPSGRFTDRSAFGDFSNAFGQSYAVLALNRTARKAPARASAYLAGQQCADGGVPITFELTPCVGDVDATALAVQALRSTGRSTAADRGVAWLVARQQPGGGLAAGDGTGTPNANSTGVAGQAFADARRVLPALKAGVHLAKLQVRCSGAVADRGSIPFEAADSDPSTTARATAQGVLGLTGVGLSRLTAAGSRPGAPVLACSPR